MARYRWQYTKYSTHCWFTSRFICWSWHQTNYFSVLEFLNIPPSYRMLIPQLTVAVMQRGESKKRGRGRKEEKFHCSLKELKRVRAGKLFWDDGGKREKVRDVCTHMKEWCACNPQENVVQVWGKMHLQNHSSLRATKVGRKCVKENR